MEIREIGLSFMRSGGKRLRPRLCEEVYRSLTPDGAADLTSLQEALESFHKASLVHDDIQDGDEERYGRPTVWKAHGVPMAIAVGDWLLAHGVSLIAASAFPNRHEMISATADAILRLSEGQGAELAGSADYVAVAAGKTGSLFALAAELGALAAGADPAPYREWGRIFGVLFQIRDDLADGDAQADLQVLKDEYERRLAALSVGPFLSAVPRRT